LPLPEASPDETLPASILYEDDELLVVHRPAAGEPTLITFADLTFRPKEHSIWGQEAATKLGLNAIGFVAKRENWFPVASVQAAAPAVRAALRGPAMTYGYSMGGYGALKYATLLGAARAFAVCPQTSIAPTEVPWDTRFHKFYKASLHAGMAIGPGEAGEVAVLLADPYMPEDCRHAKRISREAGVNWVRTPFMDHAAIWLLVGGDFLPQVMGMIMEADLAGLAGVMRARRHTSPHWFRHAGNAAFRHNHVPLANRLWLRALELGLAKTIAEQDATRALRERMRALNQAGKRDAARDLALLQADLRPESFAIQAQVGHALLGMQEAAAAEQPFRAALKLRKNVGNVYQGLSVVLSSSGRLKEAVTLCRTGMKLAPGDDGLQIHLGHMLLNSGRVEEAEDVFRSLLEVNPRHSKALLGLSNSLAARGEREEAIEVARSLITEGESDIQAYLWLGQLLLFMGEPEEAEPVFRHAVSLDNASGAAQIGLARALERSGRMEEARYVATRAAEALPNDAKLQAMARRVGPPAPDMVFEEGEVVQPRSRLRRFFGAFLRR
jgi:tetratricopeptide (TPR) repeat protein